MNHSSAVNIQSILILYNSQKPHANEALELAQSYLHGRGIHTEVAEHLLPTASGKRDGKHISTLALLHDAILVLGGDGTILGIAREIALSPRPLLGINLGGFGFLTACGFQKMTHALNILIEGRYKIVKRHFLEARIVRVSSNNSEQVIFQSRALNEALVTLLSPGRLLELWVGEHEKHALAYRADGLIVATPTGSTGHSLSAGGPILEPNLAALIITPVSPHSLFNRPLVFDGEKELGIWFRKGTAEIGLILDGQIRTSLHSTDRVFIRRSKETLPMIMLPDLSFTQILRHKFNLGDRS